MHSKILESVIELTNNSDLDSLDLSLLSTLAEYVPIKRIGIYLAFNAGQKRHVMLKVGLEIVDEKPNYRWSTCELVHECDPLMMSCLQYGSSMSGTNDNGDTLIWMPVGSLEERTCLFIQTDRLSSEAENLLNAFCRIYGNYIELITASERDKLTGLYSRHSFESRLKFLLKMQSRIQEELHRSIPRRHHFEGDVPWLVIFDLDNFKSVNDSFGHLCGDEVLLTFAQKLKSFFRASDLVFRFGGEEFVLILEPTTKEHALSRIEEFRESIAQTDFPLVGRMTVSGGMTAVSPNIFESVLLDHADKALYYSKENGRNAVYCYEDLVADEKLSAPGKIESDVQMF